MSMRKRFLFAMLFTIVALAPAGRVSVHKAEFDVPKPKGGGANMPSRWLKTFHTKDELLPALFLPIQFKNPQDLGVGKLLVASRSLGDPDFAETVVLLVRYDEKGALGLILNRRTHIPISRVLDLEAAKDRSDPLYLGGPVGPSAVFALFESPAKMEKAENIFGGVYMISDKELSNKQCRRGLTLAFFTFTWDMPDGRKINCGTKRNWARGSFFRPTPPRYSIPIRTLCGCG